MELYYNSAIFTINALVGPIVIITAIILWIKPPSKINSIYGYRTKRSMSSQRNWDFSQKYSAKLMLKSGIFLSLISMTGLFFRLSETLEVLIGLSIMTLALLYPLYQTEQILKSRKQDEKNN